MMVEDSTVGWLLERLWRCGRLGVGKGWRHRSQGPLLLLLVVGRGLNDGRGLDHGGWLDKGSGASGAVRW